MLLASAADAGIGTAPVDDGAFAVAAIRISAVCSSDRVYCVLLLPPDPPSVAPLGFVMITGLKPLWFVLSVAEQ